MLVVLNRSRRSPSSAASAVATAAAPLFVGDRCTRGKFRHASSSIRRMSWNSSTFLILNMTTAVM